MQTTAVVSSPKRSAAIRMHRLAYGISRHWMLLFSLIFGLYVGLPFLAPVFMEIGLPALGRIIYTLYSFLCHQLPERSFFLFGPSITLPLVDILPETGGAYNPLVLRQFTGSEALGWKVAWSDRMVSMYTSIWFLAWGWWFLRKKIRPISWKIFLLFLLPMALDGTTHMISDILGMHEGFRSSNAWLAALTLNALPANFYAGDAWGSFNSIMRLFTGIVFGIGIVWFGFPYLDTYFTEQTAWIKSKFERANLKL